MAALTKASTTNMSVYSSARMYCSPGYSTGLDPDRPDPRQGVGPMSRTRPAVTLGLTAHTRVKPTMCLRQAGAIADIGFFHSGQSTSHSISARQHKNYDHGDCNGDSSIYTGRSGWWREQLFTGPAVKVSRDERHPLKAQFYEWLNNSDNNGGLTFFYLAT